MTQKQGLHHVRAAIVFGKLVPGLSIGQLKRSKIIDSWPVVIRTALVVLRAGCCRRCNIIELNAAQNPCRRIKKSCFEGPKIVLQTSRTLRNEVVGTWSNGRYTC